MSVLNKYPNLPGLLTVFKDGGLQLKIDANPPTTKSMLILGTAVDGPVGEPVAVDPTTVGALFGASVNGNGVPNGATLVAAFEEAYKGGCRDIRLMRISGEAASASLKAPAVSENESVVEQQQLGIAMGNDETQIKLSNVPIVDGSVMVRANGVGLSTGVIVDETTGDVIVEANKCSAGASLAASYSYYELTTGTEAQAVVDNAGTLEIELAYEALSVSAINDGPVTVAADQYAITDGKIVLIAGAVDSAAVVIDNTRTFNVTYVGKTGNVIQATENTGDEGPFVAAYSEQILPITYAPTPGSVHLYANGTEVLDINSFRVDGPGKKIIIKKQFFAKGAVLSTSYRHDVVSNFTPEITFESIFGGSVYNNTSIKTEAIVDVNDNVIGKKVVLTKPEGKKAQTSEEPLEYSSLDYANFRLLVNAINEDSRNNIVKAATAYESTPTADLVVVPITYFNGGNDGLNLSDEETFEALSGKRDAGGLLTEVGAYQYLEDYKVDSVVVKGISADTVLSGRFSNFAYDLAMFCAYLSYRNDRVHGYIALNPPKDVRLGDISEYAKAAAAYTNEWLMKDAKGNLIKDSEGNPIDIGQYISVVAGPQVQINIPSLGRTYTDGAALFASFMTTLLPQSAPTNKALTGAIGLKYKLSNAQLDAISGNRMITFKVKDNGQVVVVDGVSAALKGSDYSRLTNINVAKESSDNVREVCEPFIGEPNTIEQRNAMSSLIEKRLSKLKEVGVILDYEFQVISSLQDQLLGEATVELTIVPPQELRKITTIVSLKPAL